MSDPKIIPQNFVNWKYFDINQIQNLKTCKDKRFLYFIDFKPHAFCQRILMTFNIPSNQEILILISMLFYNQESLKYTLTS